MLELRSLTIAQGERPLWQGLSLTVKAGERLGISLPRAVMARPRWGGYWPVGNRFGLAVSSCWMGSLCLNR